MKKGRHRRYEEARALKRNQELDIDEIFDSLETGEGSPVDEGYSPAFEAWAEEFPGDEDRAEAILVAGMVVARAAGDAHALAELEELRAENG